MHAPCSPSTSMHKAVGAGCTLHLSCRYQVELSSLTRFSAQPSCCTPAVCPPPGSACLDAMARLAVAEAKAKAVKAGDSKAGLEPVRRMVMERLSLAAVEVGTRVPPLNSRCDHCV